MLTAIEVKNAKPGRRADGDGLYLLVRPSGSRSWVLRTRSGGKRKDLGLGPVPAVSLAQARAKAADIRKRIKGGQNARATNLGRKPVIPSFADAAPDCHAALKPGWRNKRHQNSWLATLERHILPPLGNVAVDAITSIMVRDALTPIWLKIPETAKRVLKRIGSVLDYAHLSGWKPQEASLRAVPKGLPRQPTEENHFLAMPYEEVPSFVAQVLLMSATASRDALPFTIHTAVRSGETRLALWSEIDLHSQYLVYSRPPYEDEAAAIQLRQSAAFRHGDDTAAAPPGSEEDYRPWV